MGNSAEIKEDPGDLPETLFVLWGFPELSQTFIHREMVLMQERGIRVNVLAAHRVEDGDPDPCIQDISRRALTLGSPIGWGPRALAYAARHPARFGRTLTWVLSRKHRSHVHRLRALGVLAAAASVADDVAAGGYEYLHAHFAAFHAELAMDISRLTGIPYGVTGHAMGIWRDRNILEDKIAGARVILTCTAFNAEHLRSIAPEHADKIHLVHHGLDLEALAPPPPLPGGDETRWLACGRLVPKKGFDTLLAACSLLRDGGSRFRLGIIGAGPEERKLRALATELKLDGHVRFLGRVDNRRVLEEIGRSHALVVPSVRDRRGDIDGIPNVIIEAMALERPVVGSDLSGIPEVIRPGETGLLVEPGDALGLSDAMARIGEDRDAAAAMGARGRRLIEERFDVRRNIEEQIRLLARAGKVR
jgi:glycosyltransferase involved in cell wall biosynthesis